MTMSAWREAMNADILAFFDIDDPDADVIDIDIDQEDRGPSCQTCRWTVFIVEVTVSTRYGTQRRRHEGSITEFLNAVTEAAEARTATAQADDPEADTYLVSEIDEEDDDRDYDDHPAWVYG